MGFTLYDAGGRAVAYCDDGRHLYAFHGEPLAYIDGDSVYAFHGEHLGWWDRGWVRDHLGACAFFTEAAIGTGPMLPPTQAHPLKAPSRHPVGPHIRFPNRHGRMTPWRGHCARGCCSSRRPAKRQGRSPWAAFFGPAAGGIPAEQTITELADDLAGAGGDWRRRTQPMTSAAPLGRAESKRACELGRAGRRNVGPAASGRGRAQGTSEGNLAPASEVHGEPRSAPSAHRRKTSGTDETEAEVEQATTTMGQRSKRPNGFDGERRFLVEVANDLSRKSEELARASRRRRDQILALPTLIRRLPLPVKKIIGDLTSAERVLVRLDMRQRAGRR